MANTFKVVSHDVMPATSGTPEALYATPGSTTTVVIGLILANIHTAQVTASVILVSDTSGGGRAATNTTTFLAKNIPIPVGGSVSPLVGKIVLETTDILQIDCSVADTVSVTASIMEIT